MAKARARSKPTAPRRLPRGRHALAPEAVLRDQRERLLDAVPGVAPMKAPTPSPASLWAPSQNPRSRSTAPAAPSRYSPTTEHTSPRSLGPAPLAAASPSSPAASPSTSPNANVYIGDYGNRIWRYTPSADPVTELDYSGGIATTFNPCQIAAHAGNVYAVDYAFATPVATDPSIGDVYVDEGSQIAPAGMACGASCQANFEDSTEVTPRRRRLADRLLRRNRADRTTAGHKPRAGPVPAHPLPRAV